MAGTDYLLNGGSPGMLSVVLAPGQAYTDVKLTAYHSRLVEEKTASLSIVPTWPSTGYVVSKAPATVVIKPLAHIAITAVDRVATEGSTTDTAVLRLTRTGGDLSDPLVLTGFNQNSTLWYGLRADWGDYVHGTAFFAPGQQTADLKVYGVGDSFDENPLRLNSYWSDQPGYDDHITSYLTFDGYRPLGRDNRRDPRVAYTLTVSATFGTDYTVPEGGGSVTIPAGQSFALVSLAPLDDPLYEREETVTLTLRPGAGFIGKQPLAATVTLADNDPRPVATVVVTDDQAAEDPTSDVARFTVTLSAAAAVDITVQHQTAQGSATSGKDCVALSGFVLIPAGQKSALVTVAAIVARR